MNAFHPAERPQGASALPFRLTRAGQIRRRDAIPHPGRLHLLDKLGSAGVLAKDAPAPHTGKVESVLGSVLPSLPDVAVGLLPNRHLMPCSSLGTATPELEEHHGNWHRQIF